MKCEKCGKTKMAEPMGRIGIECLSVKTHTRKSDFCSWNCLKTYFDITDPEFDKRFERSAIAGFQ